jgi:hypothetical protein
MRRSVTDPSRDYALPGIVPRAKSSFIIYLLSVLAPCWSIERFEAQGIAKPHYSFVYEAQILNGTASCPPDWVRARPPKGHLLILQ